MADKGKRQSDIDDVLDVLSSFQDMVAQRFDEHDKQFEEVNKKLDHIYSVLDSHMKRIEDILQENAMRDRQQDRMQQWIFQLADKMNVKLKYEQ